jgi:hypothetical protein
MNTKEFLKQKRIRLFGLNCPNEKVTFKESSSPDKPSFLSQPVHPFTHPI